MVAAQGLLQLCGKNDFLAAVSFAVRSTGGLGVGGIVGHQDGFRRRQDGGGAIAVFVILLMSSILLNFYYWSQGTEERIEKNALQVRYDSLLQTIQPPTK
jgi:hypothetical protein